MEDAVFYSTANHHNERQIRILSVGSLVSKPPTKEKRISIKVRMSLSGTVDMGSPEWIESAFLYVARNHQKVTLDNEFEGYCLEFSVENLFGEPIVSQNCIMRGFEVFEMGSDECPDVVISFTIRMPFSGNKKWEWFGQFVGEDVWVKFTPGEAGTAKVEEEDGTLLDDGENEDGPDGDEDSEEGEYDPDSGEVIEMPLEKSGPSVLKAFHEKTIENEQKRGRGRPKKDAVDPLTVESPMAF